MVPGVIYMMPEVPCIGCAQRGHPCLLEPKQYLAVNRPACLSCRWRVGGSYTCEHGRKVTEGDTRPRHEMEDHPYMFDGRTFVPFHHDRPFVAPSDNNTSPSVDQFEFLGVTSA